uniref:Uncharacterized protein n=1 Tax=Cacopsylla melanoneura TaxID=428564 RepID=A0A8D8M543_9HEMI
MDTEEIPLVMRVWTVAGMEEMLLIVVITVVIQLTPPVQEILRIVIIGVRFTVMGVETMLFRIVAMGIVVAMGTTMLGRVKIVRVVKLATGMMGMKLANFMEMKLAMFTGMKLVMSTIVVVNMRAYRTNSSIVV